MIGLAALEKLVTFVHPVLVAILLYRILRNSSLHRYRFFAIYLSVDLLTTIVGMWFHPRSEAFARVWMARAPLIWIAYVLVVFELYSRILESHKGIATVGRMTMVAFVGVAALASGLTLLVEINNNSELYPILLAMFAAERSITLSLMLLLVLLMVFLLWFPMSLSRNMVLHSCVFFVFFLAKSVGLFIRNYQGHVVTQTVSTALLLIGVGCFLTWIFGLTAKGETVRARTRPVWNEGDAERVMGQLDAINATLLRAARK